MVFRLDGDEFGIVASNSGPQEMENFYAILHKTFSQQQEYNGKKYYCTLSGGCAFYPADANHYLDLFKYAGYSLEYAKNMGKNQVVFFSHEILAHKARLLEMTELLRESVANQFQNFTLYYQPQVYAATGKLKGAEALARWHCETYGSIGPNEFIPLLEESGLIHAVGKWIFKQAVDTCAHWVEKMPDFTMSINLSYLQLTQEDFIPFMQKTLAEKHLQPRHIIVELTESCIASSIDMLADTFKKIRSLRCV